MKHKKELKKMGIKILTRLWFRLLWQKFDLGGISVGRSIRCEMLDCFLDFTPIPELERPLDEYTDGLQDEIFNRPVCKKRRRFITLEEIKVCTQDELPLIGLGALLALEWSVHKDVAWNEGYEIERKKIREVLRRFPCICISRKSNIKEVCEAVRTRRSDFEYQDFQKTISLLRS